MSTSSKIPVNLGFVAAIVLLSSLPVSAAPVSQRQAIQWYAGMGLGDFQGRSIAAWRDALSQPWRLGGEPVAFMVGNGGDRTRVDR